MNTQPPSNALVTALPVYIGYTFTGKENSKIVRFSLRGQRSRFRRLPWGPVYLRFLLSVCTDHESVLDFGSRNSETFLDFCIKYTASCLLPFNPLSVKSFFVFGIIFLSVL